MAMNIGQHKSALRPMSQRQLVQPSLWRESFLRHLHSRSRTGRPRLLRRWRRPRTRLRRSPSRTRTASPTRRA
eukprot:3292249-Pleurochrysis_carterae.AAC.2